MTTTNRLAFAAMLVSALIFQTQTCHALSKSQTVQVSCTIVPMMQLSTSTSALTASGLDITSNLGKNFTISENNVMRNSIATRILSVTAL